MSAYSWQPKDNTDKGEKILIRRRLLEAIENPSILECYAGQGKIYQQCYAGLPYLGLDTKPITDGRRVLQIDNRKYLRAADLHRHNVFDLDAYGSPWHQFMIILARRSFSPGEKVAVFLTDGLDFKMRMSSLPNGMRVYLNIPRQMNIPNLNAHHEFIAKRLIFMSAEKAGLSVETALAAHSRRKTMLYVGLVFCKKV